MLRMHYTWTRQTGQRWNTCLQNLSASVQWFKQVLIFHLLLTQITDFLCEKFSWCQLSIEFTKTFTLSICEKPVKFCKVLSFRTYGNIYGQIQPLPILSIVRATMHIHLMLNRDRRGQGSQGALPTCLLHCGQRCRGKRGRTSWCLEYWQWMRGERWRIFVSSPVVQQSWRQSIWQKETTREGRKRQDQWGELGLHWITIDNYALFTC